VISSKNYTFYIASTPGKMRKLIVPAYVLHGLAALAIIGSITVLAAVGSYSRMLWKVGNYNAVRQERDVWKKQVRELQSTVKDTNQRLDAVQSLATDVAMTFGVMKYHPAAFEQTDAPSTPEDEFDRAVADCSYTPSVWPVLGHITDSFGERLDPFSGEGAFHTGVDVGADYGAPVHATADGVVLDVGQHSGYGRVVILDHGFGITTWYAHLSAYAVVAGTRIKRGEVIGYTGISGRSTGPHVHYEVRVNNAPVNPWRYMRSNPSAD